MKMGQEVVAKTQITEVTEEGMRVYAEPGEVGQVVDDFQDGWLMVAWDSGSTQCHENELNPHVEEVPAQPEQQQRA